MPGSGISHPPGIGPITLSPPNVYPPSVDRSNTSPAGPAHARYTSPLTPTAGTTPSTVPSLSLASPGESETCTGGVNVRAPSRDRENQMWVLWSGSELPYTSNRVHATYTFPRCGESSASSTPTHGLS